MGKEKQWKYTNKPAVCTANPIEHLLPKDTRLAIINKIKQESMEIYGEDLLTQCNKRKICFTKKCLGRELPWKSPTALPYLLELAKSQKIENELLFIETDCSLCPLVNSCGSPCGQIRDYLARDKTTGPQITSKSNYDKNEIKQVDMENNTKFSINIPWDSLSSRRREVIKLHLYQRHDFKYIADKLKLNNQARAKYEYYAALTTISEYATMREFLNNNSKKLTGKQKKVLELVYMDNRKLQDVADDIGVTKQAIQQMIARVIQKYNIKWPKFVKKQGTRVIYNIPSLLR